MKKNYTLRTWVEINQTALRHNVSQFKHLLKKKTKFGAVVKSNAYGHGLLTVAQILKSYVDWFLVDTFIEGFHLRKAGIRNNILVLGHTLPVHFESAVAENISLTVSQFESLTHIIGMRRPPAIHLKFDTGMHRQGFYAAQSAEVGALCRRNPTCVEGIYTHFAAAKDMTYPHYTAKQLRIFQEIKEVFSAPQYPHLISHAAASGGVLVSPASHFDLVRVGMGMYGYYPSPELKEQTRWYLKEPIRLTPVLSWKALVSEVKQVPADEPIGYDLTEYMTSPTTIGILPIGYWHGFDRGLSSVGEVLMHGMRCAVKGRVSMDMIAVAVPTRTRVYDVATLVGNDGRESIFADEIARKLGTSPYEILTRINPLIERVLTQ
ncbi:MAG: alanine racemase [Patescibacteria group bacterium]|nr:alanine racemase [Patescibacteria group bacterium]